MRYHKTTTAQIARIWIHHRQRKLGSDGCVHSITALAEHLHTNLACTRVRRYHSTFSGYRLFLYAELVGVDRRCLLCLRRRERTGKQYKKHEMRYPKHLISLVWWRM